MNKIKKFLYIIPLCLGLCVPILAHNSKPKEVYAEEVNDFDFYGYDTYYFDYWAYLKSYYTNTTYFPTSQNYANAYWFTLDSNYVLPINLLFGNGNTKNSSFSIYSYKGTTATFNVGCTYVNSSGTRNYASYVSTNTTNINGSSYPIFGTDNYKYGNAFFFVKDFDTSIDSVLKPYFHICNSPVEVEVPVEVPRSYDSWFDNINDFWEHWLFNDSFVSSDSLVSFGGDLINIDITKGFLINSLSIITIMIILFTAYWVIRWFINFILGLGGRYE